MIERRLNSWRPELPDHRDRPFKARAAPIKPRVDPLGAAGRIHDQGRLGSCTGHAGTSALEVAMGMRGDSAQLSRLMAYYSAREVINEVDRDEGAYIRDIFKTVLKQGVSPETNWRYDQKKVFTKPTKTAYGQAELVRQRFAAAGLVYERITDLGGLLSALSDGCPVVFGFVVYPQLFALTAENNILPFPVGSGQVPQGGHAVMADGYDLEQGFVWVQNSWGTKWGARGYFKMPFEWFSDPRRLTDDLWLVRRTIPAVLPI